MSYYSNPYEIYYEREKNQWDQSFSGDHLSRSTDYTYEDTRSEDRRTFFNRNESLPRREYTEDYRGYRRSPEPRREKGYRDGESDYGWERQKMERQESSRYERPYEKTGSSWRGHWARGTYRGRGSYHRGGFYNTRKFDYHKSAGRGNTKSIDDIELDRDILGDDQEMMRAMMGDYDEDELEDSNYDKKRSSRERSSEKRKRESREKSSDRRKPGGGEKKSREDKDATEPKVLDTKSDTDYRSIPAANDPKGVPLKCPQCAFVSNSYKEYEEHLKNAEHMVAMKNMLTEQLIDIRELRAAIKLEYKKEPMRQSQVNHCQICQVFFSEDISSHNDKKLHKEIESWLSPSCRGCDISFLSVMHFQEHLCELEHFQMIAKAQGLDLLAENDLTTMTKTSELMKEDEEKRKGEKRDLLVVGKIDDYIQLKEKPAADVKSTEVDEDQPRKVSENEVEIQQDNKKQKNENIAEEQNDNEVDKEEDEKPEEEPTSNAETKETPKGSNKMGTEFCKNVKVLYCRLCKSYLGKNKKGKKAVEAHCLTREHLQRLLFQLQSQTWTDPEDHPDLQPEAMMDLGTGMECKGDIWSALDKDFEDMLKSDED